MRDFIRLGNSQQLQVREELLNAIVQQSRESRRGECDHKFDSREFWREWRAEREARIRREHDE